MSSVEYNLSKKLEWMARKIRHIDNVLEIKDWVEVMASINSLLQNVKVKVYSDDWRPWITERKTQKPCFKKGLHKECLQKNLKDWSIDDRDIRRTTPQELHGCRSMNYK